MNNSLEAELIIHAAPTLASLKPANLFGYRYDSRTDPDDEIRRLNNGLIRKGIRMIRLMDTGNRALIYVYRERDLKFILDQEENQDFLYSLGYFYMDEAEALGQLASRVRAAEGFPHEIGLFLGYPLADVTGFMEDKGEHAACEGLWKCYVEPEKAMKYFSKLEKCATIYARSYEGGRTLDQLTVAS